MGPRYGVLVEPGTYSVTLSKRVDGVLTELAGPQSFEVTRLRDGALPGASPEEAARFYRRVAEVERAVAGARKALAEARERAKLMALALDQSRVSPGGALDAEVRDLERRLVELAVTLDGGGARHEIGEPVIPSVARRLQVARAGRGGSTYGPTATHRRSLELTETGFAEIRDRLAAIVERELPDPRGPPRGAGVPWTPGRGVPGVNGSN